MTCRNLPIKWPLRVGNVYHVTSVMGTCLPFLYIGYLAKTVEAGGVSYFAGWQFLPLYDRPTGPRGARLTSHRRYQGKAQLIARLHEA